MKKIKNFLRFILISVFVFIILAVIGQIIFMLIWNFDLLNKASYNVLKEYWLRGGVFNTFRDCSLVCSLLSLPIIWVIWSRKIYKKGFWKSVLSIIDKVYRKATRPQNLEVEHVSIKNIGGKEKTLDEIITDKIKEQNGATASGHMSTNLRKQIAAKIGENEKQ